MEGKVEVVAVLLKAHGIDVSARKPKGCDSNMLQNLYVTILIHKEAEGVRQLICYKTNMFRTDVLQN